VIDGCAVDRVVAANRYLVLGTADGDGLPWVTPVFFALLDPDRVCWVSSPDSRHSRNIARRARVAITIFDSSVEVGRAEAVYFDVDAAQATADESDTALQSLSSRYRTTSD
jgi:nitroimidazol reductase NimA-like FMN-containing flavoprotein (pyridoxamine 5'-phosphate oxidase superfamily)